MGSADKTHFTEYRLQNAVKHAILEKYLRAYFEILKKHHEKMVYIDGFAGPGHYAGGEVEGSPLRAMAVINDIGVSDRVQCVFIERRGEYIDDLREAVNSCIKGNPKALPPKIILGDFSEKIQSLLAWLKESRKQLAPTFLFVDPCGIKGASLDCIAGIVRHWACEALVFFNLDAVRRVEGAGLRGTLSQLFGSEERVLEVQAELSRLPEPEDREAAIVNRYMLCLQDEGQAPYTLPFRVEHEGRATTSHYLIHVTKNSLGFRVMKDVMWGESTREGRLELLQASADQTLVLIQPEIQTVRAAILDELRRGARSVSWFRKDWAERPDDRISSHCYWRTLLELESEGVVEVWNSTNSVRQPAAIRPKVTKGSYKGTPSLANDKIVRLAAQSSSP